MVYYYFFFVPSMSWLCGVQIFGLNQCFYSFSLSQLTHFIINNNNNNNNIDNNNNNNVVLSADCLPTRDHLLLPANLV